MTRRWLVAAALVLVATACNGDDDDAVESSVAATTAAPETVATTSPPDATEAPAITSTTVEATTTTVDVEALKAQITEDYLRSWEHRRELTENPTLDGLDDKLAQISAPGSQDSENLRTLVNELVSLGERIAPGSPDLFSIEVENVELGPEPTTEATVTICYIRNRVRVDSTGNVVTDLGIVASRSQDHLISTAEGWLPDTGFVDLWEGLGVTQCPDA